MYSRKMDGKENMRKDIIVVLFGVILITSVFCGCQSSQVKEDYKAIFKSDVVNLVNYSVETKKNKTDIVQVTVNGRIENIVDRMINVKITADIYDKNNEYLGNSTFKIKYLRPKPNPGYSTTFTIVYNEENVYKLDHIKLRAEEMP
jgi:hypothetical protein